MNLRYVIKELYHQRRRTIISILGLSIGIAQRHGELFHGKAHGEDEATRYFETAMNADL